MKLVTTAVPAMLVALSLPGCENQPTQTQAALSAPPQMDAAPVGQPPTPVELSVVVFDRWPENPKLGPRPAQRSADDPLDSVPVDQPKLTDKEFDAMKAVAHDVTKAPKLTLQPGIPAQITLGTPNGDPAHDVAILRARVSGASEVIETGATTATVELAYEERHDGEAVIGPWNGSVTLGPGDIAAIPITGLKGNGMRLLCVGHSAGERATGMRLEDGATAQANAATGQQAAAAPPPSPLRAQGPAQGQSQGQAQPPAPFDPLNGDYPQIFWMIHFAEADGPLSFGKGGVIEQGRGNSPAWEVLDMQAARATFAWMETLKGYHFIAEPADMSKPKKDSFIAPGTKDKAGAASGDLSSTLSGILDRDGMLVDASWSQLLGGHTMLLGSTRHRRVESGGAILGIAPPPGGGSKWFIMMVRPYALKSVKDYPFQTSTALAD